MSRGFNQLLKSIDFHKWRLALIQFVIIFALLERLLVGIGLPHSIIYIIDLINLILFFDIVRNKKLKDYKLFIILYLIFITLGEISAIFNYDQWNGNLLYSIIEIRNIIRFPIYFLACVLYLDKLTIERIFKFLTIIFYFNFVIILYQYFTFHPLGVWTRGDYLNGIFWLSVGGNSFVNVLNILVVCYWMNKWNHKSCKSWEFIAPLCLSLLVAALIELKFFFIELIIVYGWYIFTQRKNKKNLLKSILIAFFLLVLSYLLLQIMFQEYPWFRETMSLSGIINLVTDSSGYTGNNDLNRLTALFTITNDFFKNDWFYVLFGIGLGNGATYSLAGVFTDFFRIFGDFHYSWFSYSYIFVQCGLVGLLLYLSTFIVLINKTKNEEYSLLTQFAIIISFLLLIYNETLKTDAGYIIYFAISCGFVSSKKVIYECENYKENFSIANSDCVANSDITNLVSIVVTTYKGSNNLPRAIDSLLNQTYKNIEIIVVDDNDSDSAERKKTELVMENYQNRREIVYIKHKQNQNGAVARNTGIASANGDYIAFLDDDDYYLPKRIEKSLSFLENNQQFVGVYTGVDVRDEDGNLCLKVRPNCELKISDLLQKEMIIGTGSNIFVKSNIVKRIHGFDEKFLRKQDIEFMIRVCNVGRVGYISDCLIIKSTNGTLTYPKYEKMKEIIDQFSFKFKDEINSLADDKHLYYVTQYRALFNIALFEHNKQGILESKRLIKKYGHFSMKERILSFLYIYHLRDNAIIDHLIKWLK